MFVSGYLDLDKMCLFLGILSCLAALRSNIFGGNSRNSQFGGFNSRLGQQKFPIRVATGTCSNPLNWLTDFVAKGESAKYPVSMGKAGNSRVRVLVLRHHVEADDNPF